MPCEVRTCNLWHACYGSSGLQLKSLKQTKSHRCIREIGFSARQQNIWCYFKPHHGTQWCEWCKEKGGATLLPLGALHTCRMVLSGTCQLLLVADGVQQIKHAKLESRMHPYVWCSEEPRVFVIVCLEVAKRCGSFHDSKMSSGIYLLRYSKRPTRNYIGGRGKQYRIIVSFINTWTKKKKRFGFCKRQIQLVVWGKSNNTSECCV